MWDNLHKLLQENLQSVFDPGYSFGASEIVICSSSTMAPPVVTEHIAAPAERFNLGDIRFYERQYPEKEELVMVKVTRSAEMGAYVSLLEYNGVEGMILMSELSKRRIRSVKKVVRVGRHEVALVLRVDKEKGYIDLSKKRSKSIIGICY